MTEIPTCDELVATFDRSSAAHWRQLVDKALKGVPFDKRLVTRTADGIAIAPLYTAADVTDPVPSQVPSRTAGDLGWEITALIEDGDAHAANRAILAELEGGANAVLVRVAAPGQHGVSLHTASDWSTALTGVDLDLATLVVDAGLGGLSSARALAEALGTTGGSPAGRRVCLGLDPIGAFARHGTLGTPIEAAPPEAVLVMREFAASSRAVRPIIADASIYHEAGASEAQELAAMAATVTAYLRAFEADGVSPAAAMGRIDVRLSADTDIFAAAAKLRAARTILARIATASGAGNTTSGFRLSVVTSARMMSRRDPWTNMLRTTVATTAAAIGGADAILTLPFNYALGLADPFARRIARNIQIVAQEESALGRVRDPASGSFYVERLTAELADAGWRLFQDIEVEGGIVAALRSGGLQSRIAGVAAERFRAIATGRLELTGVSAYPLLGDDGITVQPRPAPASLPTAPEIVPLAPIRLAGAFEDLRDRADRGSTRPTVFLASLGAAAEHTARSTWIRNLLASGGIAVAGGGDYETVDALAEAFRTAGNTIAVIASSDAVYARLAEPAALALKAVGARHVALAGRPGDAEAGYRAVGIDRFIFAGQDQIAMLDALLDLAMSTAAQA